jgi:hypothetical protein
MLEEVAHDWHLGYLGALGLLGAIRYLGAIGLLIILKLSLPRDGVRGCSAPCYSMLYVHSSFKDGTDLTVFVMLQVSYACFVTSKRCYYTYECMCSSF